MCGYHAARAALDRSFGECGAWRAGGFLSWSCAGETGTGGRLHLRLDRAGDRREDGHVVFEWHSLDHVPVPDSYIPVAQPYDYFHVNSIDVDLDGSLLVSARNTSTVYSLDRKTGAVRWRLGGKSSDLALGPEAAFMWQHDARFHPDGTVTLYDDDLLQDFRHPSPLAAIAMGSAQVLTDDGVFVGWGTAPFFTEFAPNGAVRFDASFVGEGWNYRAFRDEWTGRPATRPALGSALSNGRTTLYASWNGSTETRYWEARAGKLKDDLATVKTVRRNGFETAISLPGHASFAAVAALDAERRELAVSATLALPA